MGIIVKPYPPGYPAAYPTLEELMQEQGVCPIADPRELLGDFWPDDESIELFLDALRDWRGHGESDRAA